jgi:hypothetical protein
MEKHTPNKLLQSGYMLLSKEPLVGVVVLETEKGIIDFGVNRAVAEELRQALDDLLAGKQSPKAPKK